MRRVYVDPEEYWFKVEVDVDAKPSLIWDYLTDPQLKASLASSRRYDCRRC
ncbi:MAG: hypothetical protein O6759_07450 [Candidatus Dadabacteria bacterium]|nr:hypothetical protein [Candidatus Dadabacteria bacterium]